jgi:hypothetical protein
MLWCLRVKSKNSTSHTPEDEKTNKMSFGEQNHCQAACTKDAPK